MTVRHYQPIGFSERLHKAYIDSGLEVTEIAKRSGVARSSVYGYMYYGTPPSIGALAKICEILQVSADYLLFGKEAR